MKYLKIAIALIFLIALLLRVTPVIISGMPALYDSPFHINQANFIVSNEELNNIVGYPPLYHILLSTLSIFSGLDVIFLGAILLPLISAFLVISIFVYLKDVQNEKIALIGSFLIAVSTPLIISAFDSPENVLFLFIPVLLMLKDKRPLLASFIFATCLWWNYSLFLFVMIILITSHYKSASNFILSLMGFSMLIFGLDVLLNISALFEIDFFAGMNFIAGNVANSLPPLIIASLIIGIPLLYFNWKNNRIWRNWLIISLIGMVSFFVTPYLRAWEFFKLAGYGGIVLFTNLKDKKHFNKIAIGFGAVSLIASLLLVSYFIFPRIYTTDLNSFKYLEENYSTGLILAEPSLSEYIILYTELDEEVFMSLFYEKLGKTDKIEVLDWLSGKVYSEEFFKERNFNYFIRNFEDIGLRNTNVESFNKIYELSYDSKRTEIFSFE